MRTTARKLAAIGAVAALGFAGGACASGDDGSTSPGQEAPAGELGTTDDTGGELGTTDGAGTTDSSGLGSTEGTATP